MTMEQYDAYCQANYPEKLPDWRNRDYRRRVGDCIYNFSEGMPPKMHKGVHDERNRESDLGGRAALLSSHFYYFGDRPVSLEDESLKPIAPVTQGHRSHSNDPYREQFVSWITGLGFEPNGLYGEPQLKQELVRDIEIRKKCARRDLAEDNEDEEYGETEE